MARIINTIDILRQVPFFKDLTENELYELDSFARPRKLRKKNVIFTEGSEKEALFFIQSGLIKTYYTDEKGHEHIVSYLKKGDMFPHTALCDNPLYPSSAESIMQTVLLVVPIRPLERFLLKNTTVAFKIMRVLIEKINELQREKQELTGQDTQHRGQMFLLKLAEHYGKTKNGELRIGIPMSHQYFAYTIGSSRETGNRFLKKMKKEGIVDMHRSGFVIHDVESLKHWKETGGCSSETNGSEK